jgi:long-chain acyl-CoA synthetase
VRRRPSGTHDLLELAAAHAGQRPDPAPTSPEDVAILTYTSGTTGPAKGAMNTHANLGFTSQVFRDWMHVGGQDVILGIAPLFHVTGLVAHIGLALSAGVPIVLAHRFDAAETCRLIERHRATATVAAITAFLALLESPESERCDLSSLHKAYSGGAPIPPAVVEAFERRTGIVVRSAYGLTETTSPTHLTPLGRRAPVDPDSGALSAGIPVFNTAVRIVDETGAPLGVGEVGEVALSGPQVVPGYWNRPEESAHAIRDGELLTGDVGKMDADGWLYLVDRRKDLIVASGYKVWPREVEDVLYTHPAVREAAVVGVPDERWGEVPRAFVSLVPGSSADEAMLIEWVRARLAGFKVPRSVVILEDLPKGGTGKIQKQELRARADDPPR